MDAENSDTQISNGWGGLGETCCKVQLVATDMYIIYCMIYCKFVYSIIIVLYYGYSLYYMFLKNYCILLHG